MRTRRLKMCGYTFVCHQNQRANCTRQTINITEWKGKGTLPPKHFRRGKNGNGLSLSRPRCQSNKPRTSAETQHWKPCVSDSHTRTWEIIQSSAFRTHIILYSLRPMRKSVPKYGQASVQKKNIARHRRSTPPQTNKNNLGQ